MLLLSLPYLWLAATAVLARPEKRGLAVGLEFKFGVSNPQVFRSSALDVVTSKVLPLKISSKGSLSFGYLSTARESSPVDGYYGLSPIGQLFDGQVFITEIEWGGKNHTVVLDTGSSDTWLVEKVI